METFTTTGRRRRPSHPPQRGCWLRREAWQQQRQHVEQQQVCRQRWVGEQQVWRLQQRQHRVSMDQRQGWAATQLRRATAEQRRHRQRASWQGMAAWMRQRMSTAFMLAHGEAAEPCSQAACNLVPLWWCVMYCTFSSPATAAHGWLLPFQRACPLALRPLRPLPPGGALPGMPPGTKCFSATGGTATWSSCSTTDL